VFILTAKGEISTKPFRPVQSYLFHS
jgi:hypothetical protein